MERRRALSAGAALTAAVFVRPPTAGAAEGPGRPLTDHHIAVGRRLFAAGSYDRLATVLPLLLAAAQGSVHGSPSGAARAARVWVLASQLAVKQDHTQAAGIHAGQAGAAARRSGDPLVLAAAARAAATPLRRTGRAQDALDLLQEAQGQLAAGSRSSATGLDAVGMLALTASYTAAQAHRPALAREFAARAEETARRLAGTPHTDGRPRELSVAQCTLYRIGVHRELGDSDTALAYAATLKPGTLTIPERRARAATDTARALLDAGDTSGALAQLRLIDLAAPLEARRPSVRALTARIVGHRPDLADPADS